MRISDWSSDVCSSDLARRHVGAPDRAGPDNRRRARLWRIQRPAHAPEAADRKQWRRSGRRAIRDRKSVVSGKSVSVRVDLGGRRIIKKKTNHVTNLKYNISYIYESSQN